MESEPLRSGAGYEEHGAEAMKKLSQVGAETR
jgi:hypothetical protein